MSSKRKGEILMITCAVLWSLSGVTLKFIDWNPFLISGGRGIISALVVYISMKASGLHVVLSKKSMGYACVIFMMVITFISANKLTTAANAIVLQFTAPVFIVIFTALLYKQRPKKEDGLVVFFTLIGIALFFLDQLKPGYIMGNFVAIAAGMFMAGMFMTVGDLEGEPRFSGIFLGQMITFVIGLPSVILTRPELSLVPVLSILALGVFQLGIAYILFVHANSSCPPLACALLGAVEPLFNPVWVMIFDGETPGIFAFIGAIVVIVSITVWCIHGNKEEAAPVQPV